MSRYLDHRQNVRYIDVPILKRYFESIYFKRANKLNKKMGDKLRKTRKKARHKDWKERDRQEQNQ